MPLQKIEDVSSNILLFSHLTTNQPVDDEVIPTKSRILGSSLKCLLQILQQIVFLLAA